MVKYQDPALDAVFAALADSTRRGILESLSSGGAQGRPPGAGSDAGLSFAAVSTAVTV